MKLEKKISSSRNFDLLSFLRFLRINCINLLMLCEATEIEMMKERFSKRTLEKISGNGV